VKDTSDFTKSLEALLLIILGGLTASQFVLEVGNRPSVSAVNLVEAGGSQYLLSYSVSSGDYSTKLNVAYFPVMESVPRDLPIYVYYETDYVQVRSWQPYQMIVAGLLHDLQYEVEASKLDLDVILADSSKVQNILDQDMKAVLVMPTVAWFVELPQFKIGADQILQWVKNGGVAVWLGPHPRSYSELALPTKTPIEGWPDIANWRSSDVKPSNPKSVSVAWDEAEQAIRINHSDLSLIDRGFYGVFTPPNEIDISNPGACLFLKVKIRGLSYITLLYVELKDNQGNFAHYYITPESGSEWAEVVIPIAAPNRSSTNPVDPRDFRIYITGQVYPEMNPSGPSVDIWVRDLESGRMNQLVSSRWPFRQAKENTNVSDALDLKYAFVNLGVRTDTLASLNGQGIGKTYSGEQENRTSIALIPYGTGRIVVFGYGLFPPFVQTSVAKEIVRVLSSGILNMIGPLHFRSHKLDKNSSIEDHILLDSKESTKWVVFAFSQGEAEGFPGKMMLVDLEARTVSSEG